MLCRYTIPRENGSLEEGKRLLNYIWYTNIAGESSELQEAMTDTTGRKTPSHFAYWEDAGCRLE